MEKELTLTRSQIVEIFTRWKNAAVEGQWEKVSDPDINPEKSADTFIEFAAEI